MEQSPFSIARRNATDTQTRLENNSYVCSVSLVYSLSRTEEIRAGNNQLLPELFCDIFRHHDDLRRIIENSYARVVGEELHRELGLLHVLDDIVKHARELSTLAKIAGLPMEDQLLCDGVASQMMEITNKIKEEL